MADMTVNVQHPDPRLAEEACAGVFGEDANLGPVMPAPPPLLALAKAWPRRPDEAYNIALHLPVRLDLERDVPATSAVVLAVNRVTILHLGKKFGYAIRTNAAGLDAIRLWQDSWRAHHRMRAH